MGHSSQRPVRSPGWSSGTDRRAVRWRLFCVVHAGVAHVTLKAGARAVQGLRAVKRSAVRSLIRPRSSGTMHRDAKRQQCKAVQCVCVCVCVCRFNSKRRVTTRRMTSLKGFLGGNSSDLSQNTFCKQRLSRLHPSFEGIPDSANLTRVRPRGPITHGNDRSNAKTGSARPARQPSNAHSGHTDLCRGFQGWNLTRETKPPGRVVTGWLLGGYRVGVGLPIPGSRS